MAVFVHHLLNLNTGGTLQYNVALLWQPPQDVEAISVDGRIATCTATLSSW